MEALSHLALSSACEYTPVMTFVQKLKSRRFWMCVFLLVMSAVMLWYGKITDVVFAGLVGTVFVPYLVWGKKPAALQ